MFALNRESLTSRRILSFFSKNQPNLLCIWCGRRGHKPSTCTQESHSEPEPALLQELAARQDSDQNDEFCARCAMRWPKILLYFTQVSNSPNPEHGRGVVHRTCYDLGPWHEQDLHDDCPLCRFLFLLMPDGRPWNPRLERIRLVHFRTPELLGLAPTTTQRFLSYESYFVVQETDLMFMETNEPGADPDVGNQRFGNGRVDFEKYTRFRHLGTAQDGRNAEPDPSAMLCPRPVDAHVADIGIIQSWIGRCETHHPSCTPAWQETIRAIKLIDVQSSTVVRYPATGRVDYIALSYVWGSLPSNKPHQLGSEVVEPPRTIADAMAMTRRLGKRHLWVDAICIDQSDEDDKRAQLQFMKAIYGGAWVTLVALAGSDPSYGLPRASISPDSRASTATGKSANHTQSCSSTRLTLVTIPSTLQNQLNKSKWATRGWTFQEGLLSHRCLYFTDEQVHFQCNVHQACEALDDSHSHLHTLASWNGLFATPRLLPDDSGPGTPEGTRFSGRVYVTATKYFQRRDFPSLQSYPMSQAVRTFYGFVQQYSRRELTYDVDFINAFAGLREKMEELYFPLGFLWSMPRENFQAALLFRNDGVSTRRDGFPSWSWAGWRGSLLYPDPIKAEIAPGAPYVRFYETRDGRRVLLSPPQRPEAGWDGSSPDEDDGSSDDDACDSYSNGVVKIRRASIERECCVDPGQAERDGILFVDGILGTVRKGVMLLDRHMEPAEGEEYDVLWVGCTFDTRLEDKLSTYQLLKLSWDDDGVASRVALYDVSPGVISCLMDLRLERFYLK